MIHSGIIILIVSSISYSMMERAGPGDVSRTLTFYIFYITTITFPEVKQQFPETIGCGGQSNFEKLATN
jgi:hypothetical protein